METLAAIGLVGNIVQFVDFSTKLISKSSELYHSAEGALAENTDTETATTDLILLNDKLKDAVACTSDRTLRDLCESCNTVARELLVALDKVKVKGEQRKWKSVRKALRGVWNKEDVEGLERRLARFREELNLHVTVDLRQQVSQMKLEQSYRLNDLDSTTKKVVDAIARGEDVFQAAHGAQLMLMRNLHGETMTNIEDARREIICEIRRCGQEQSPTTLCRHCWSVPFTRNRKFVGRSYQLIELEAKLFVDGYCPRIAIFGLGGVGKTQIALELAYRTRDKYPACSVFWVPATTVENVQKAYFDIGQQLQIPGLEDPKEDAKRIVQHYLNQEGAGQWLLIVDNADDIDMWIKNSGSRDERTSLIDYIPRSNKGSVVFTTRSRKAAVKFAHQNVIKVAEMDEEAAIQVLSKSLVDQEFWNDHQAMLKMLNQLTFLPLAIVQAAAYINENGITLSEYLSLLGDKEQNAIEILSEEFEDEGRYRDVKNPIATTWLISFKQIRRRDPLAAEYLSFMSCLDPKAIPQSLLPPTQSRKRAVDAIGTLNAYSFITKRPADQCLDLHRLVHLATRNWLREDGSLAEWTTKAVARLADVFPNDDHRNRTVWRAYLSHTRYVLMSNLLHKGAEERLILLEKFGLCLLSDGRYDEAERPFVEVINMKRRLLGQGHPDTLCSMENLGRTHQYQGRWKEAEKLFMQVVGSRKRIFPQDHPDTLASMSSLASTYRTQGRWKECEGLLMHVLETRKRLLGEENPDTLTSMVCLASVLWNQGQWNKAEELEVHVMEMRKRVLGLEHPSTLDSMANLALTYWTKGQWKEAEELELKVMEMRKRMLDQDHPDTLTSMAQLASTYRTQGRWKESEELFVYVVETRKRVFGEEHPSTISNIANLASTLWNQGRWKEAEELDLQVVKTSLKVLGEQHFSTLTCMNNLASTYQKQGRLTEAENLFVKVGETRKKVLGPEHPDTLTSIHNLGTIYHDQGQWEKAEELLLQILEMRKRVLGPEHPETLTSMNSLAKTWKLLDRDNDAVKLMAKVVKSRKKIIGLDHPITVLSISALNEWQG